MAQVPLSSASLDTLAASAHDERADLSAVRNNLFDGEAIDRIYRGRGSDVQLLALTSQRIMMIERTAWGGQLALTSIPYGRVTAVSYLAEDNQPIDVATTIGIRVASLSFKLKCVDVDQAQQAHDLISWTLLH
ncbi:MAG: hypothetical protein QOI10_4307 [Solirubrobacterales bacterium]|jgi:hypothetical protein|nr:hypothetical protein [Solirubrobacterales bacterium]